MTGEYNAQVEAAVLGLGRGLAEEAVVTGSSAVKLALPDFRQPDAIDVAVSDEALNYLRFQEGWQENAADDGEIRLERDGLDIGTWGGGTGYNGLRSRSWRTTEGVQIAGLPDVYASKQSRYLPKDRADMDRIRQLLHDPSAAPLAAQFIPHEVADARDCLPESLRETPGAEAVTLLAANGLHIVRTLYGHPGIGQVGQIIGDLERSEYQVPATYHNGFDVIRDARRLQRHLAAINASPQDRLLALAIDPYTDAVYGNGRLKDNPQGHDELRSAQLLRGHALQLGFNPEEADRMYHAVLDTTFDETTGRQRGAHSPDVLGRAVAGVDLDTLSDSDAVRRVFDLAVEDGFSARYNPARIIGRAVCRHGMRVFSTVQGLELIDRYANERPSDTDDLTVKQAFAQRLRANAGFMRSYQYPDGWTLDDPSIREQNAIKLERIGAELLAGKLVVEAYAEQHEN